MVFDGTDLVAAAAFSTALFGALLLLALLISAREDVLGSKLGWHLVAASLALFAVRGLTHFLGPSFDLLRYGSGSIAALVLPAGLLIILMSSHPKEVDPDPPPT